MTVRQPELIFPNGFFVPAGEKNEPADEWELLESQVGEMPQREAVKHLWGSSATKQAVAEHSCKRERSECSRVS